MFNLYIKQAAEIFGVTHTREIYEKAIEVLPDEQARWQTSPIPTLLPALSPSLPHPSLFFFFSCVNVSLHDSSLFCLQAKSASSF